MPTDWARIAVIFLLAPGLLLLATVVVCFGLSNLRPPRNSKKENDV